MIRTTRQSYLRQRPTISTPHIQRTRTITWNQAEHEHRISSSDRWSWNEPIKGLKPIYPYLSIFCCNNPDKWWSLLPTLEFAYNSKPHTTQKESPLFLQMGYNPLAIPTAVRGHSLCPNLGRLSEYRLYFTLSSQYITVFHSLHFPHSLIISVVAPLHHQVVLRPCLYLFVTFYALLLLSVP